MSVQQGAPPDGGRYCLACCLERGGGDTCQHCGTALGGGPPRQPRNLPPGALLDRRYLVGRCLGSGTFGITYLAVDIWLRLRVAVKEYMPREMAMRSTEDDVVPNTDADRDAFSYGLQSFLDEGRRLATFEGHPNIVGVKTFFEENGTAYLVMQYLDGCSLEAYRRARGGRLPPGEVCAVAVAILEGLQAIHAVGMLHRDIKPHNVILTTGGQVKLIDFGAARFAAGQRTSNLSKVLTPRYAPIEQYQTDECQGPWTDVYAAGATLYRALTGELPPESIARVLEGAPLRTPREILGEGVSEKVSAALMRALEPTAHARYQSPAEFLEGLSDPEETPLVWPAPPSGHRWDDDAECSIEEAGQREAPEERSAAPAGGGARVAFASLRPGSGSEPSRRVSGLGMAPRASGSGPPRPPREPTEATQNPPGFRRRKKRRKSRSGRLWWVNAVLALLVMALGVALALLFASRREQGDAFAGCGRLSPTRCAAEAVRLDEQGQAERALLLAYLAPIEEPAVRDRIFDDAGVGWDWGSRERFGCGTAPAPCGPLDFWRADRGAPGSEQALSSLASRCDQGDRDACFLRILVQRRLTLIETEPPRPVAGAEAGAGGLPASEVSGGRAPASPPAGEAVSSVPQGESPEPGAGAAGTAALAGSSAAGSRGPGPVPSARTSEGEVEARGAGGPVAAEPATAGVLGVEERVVGERPEPSERAIDEPVEPAERVVGEPADPTERVVPEQAERAVPEATERVVPDAPDPDTSGGE